MWGVVLNPKTAVVNWIPSWRIIPSRLPSIQLFERAVDRLILGTIIELYREQIFGLK